jgi:hypothetical protein
MFLARLILLAACGLAPGHEPAALAEALGSPRAAEREEAAGRCRRCARPGTPGTRRSGTGSRR